MARNGSGTYIAPTGNPVVTNTTVTSAWANTTVTDIGSEITNSLPRDGQAPMLAALKLVSGTSTAPAVSFNSDPTTGAYYPGAGQLGLTVGGVDLVRINSAGWVRVAAGTTGVGNVQLGNSATTASNITINNDGSGNLTIGTGVIGTTTALLTLASTGALTLSGGSSSKLGLGAAPTVSIDAGTLTDAVRITVGTSAQRPTGSLGMLRYNTDTAGYEGYGGTGWAPLASSAAGFTPVIVNSNVAATAGYVYLADSTSGSFTITLPASPANLTVIAFCDHTSSWGTNAVTVSRNGKTINGSASDLTLDINRGYCELVYTSATGDWSIIDLSSANPSSSGAVGNLIGTRVFTSGGTYTPTQGTNYVIVEAVGGGGGAGGCAATGAGQVCIAGGGGGGAYGKAKFTSNFSGVTMTIGAGGNGAAAGAGNGSIGGTTSFGALLSCPGGGGGQGGGANTPGAPYVNFTTSVAAAPTGANLISLSGTVAQYTFGATYGGFSAGQGGSTPLGIGGMAFGVANSVAGTGYGSGASGSYVGASTGAVAGANGAPGVIIVYEYA